MSVSGGSSSLQVRIGRNGQKGHNRPTGQTGQTGQTGRKGQKVHKGQKGLDLVFRVGDQIGLSPEPMLGTVLLLRGGPLDGTVARHWDDLGWTIDGKTGELLTWLEVFALLLSGPGVTFEVTRVRQRCGWPLCNKGGWLPLDAPSDQRYCSPACRKAASRDSQ